MCSVITYELGLKYDDFLVEARQMVVDHWNEVGSHREILSLNPNHDKYRALERAGVLSILAARDDGRLIGYLFLLVMRHMRDQDAVVGQHDAFYVIPEYRRHMVGPRLLVSALKIFDNSGVNIVLFTEKAWRKSGRMLAKLGFKEFEMVYSKVIRPKG